VVAGTIKSKTSLQIHVDCWTFTRLNVSSISSLTFFLIRSNAIHTDNALTLKHLRVFLKHYYSRWTDIVWLYALCGMWCSMLNQEVGVFGYRRFLIVEQIRPTTRGQGRTALHAVCWQLFEFLFSAWHKPTVRTSYVMVTSKV
jgi:hypothetical protein